MRRIHTLLALIIAGLIFQSAIAAQPSRIDTQAILKAAPKLNPQALQYALRGYHWALAKHQVKNPNILTVIDFTLPSRSKRLWVINLATHKVLLNTFTTQGKHSGVYYAKHFSNKTNSDETCLGVFKTLGAYRGKHGLSLQLKGLEKGINDNAQKRAIVVHPAWYATPAFVKKYGRTGRSWGCFGLNPKISTQFINLTKNGSVIFAYAGQEQKDPNLA